MPNVSLYLKFNSMAEMKGAWRFLRKTKETIDLEKFSPFPFGGLVGFSGVCRCFRRMLPGYSTAPAAGESRSTVPPGWLTERASAPSSNIFHAEWGLHAFTLKWFPQTWRIKITSTSAVWEVNGFIRENVVFHLQTYFQPCREVMKSFSFLYTWRKWTNYVESL